MNSRKLKIECRCCKRSVTFSRNESFALPNGSYSVGPDWYCSRLCLDMLLDPQSLINK